MPMSRNHVRQMVRWLRAIGVVMVVSSAAYVVFWVDGPLRNVIDRVLGRAPSTLREAPWMLAVCACGLALLLIAYALRRLNRVPAAERTRGDPRPPILLLRPFASDHAKTPPIQVRGVAYIDVEEVLAKMFASYGPVIAVGKPRERFAPLGAARLYVDDASWQAEVDALLARCLFVLFMVDDSPGVRWELARIVDRHLEKTLFVPKVIVLRRAWLFAFLSELPLIGERMRDLDRRTSAYRSEETTRRRGARWYRQWDALRAAYPALPALHDRVACFRIGDHGRVEGRVTRSSEPAVQFHAIRTGVIAMLEARGHAARDCPVPLRSGRRHSST